MNTQVNALNLWALGKTCNPSQGPTKRRKRTKKGATGTVKDFINILQFTYEFWRWKGDLTPKMQNFEKD